MAHGITWNLILANSTFSHAKNYFHIWTNWTFFYLFVFFYKRMAFFYLRIKLSAKEMYSFTCEFKFPHLELFHIYWKICYTCFFSSTHFWAVAQEDEVPILNSPARDLTLSVLYPHRKTFVNKHNRTPIQRSGTNLNLHYNRNTASRYM